MTDSAQPLSPEDEELLQLLRQASRRSITELVRLQEQYVSSGPVHAPRPAYRSMVGGALFGAGFLFAHFMLWLLK